MTVSEDDFLPDNEGPLEQRLYDQTAMVLWKELERHFARGVVLNVNPELDLVEVAVSLVEDNTRQFRQWMENGEVSELSDSRASQWAAEQPVLWAVVAAPWVLVQENEAGKTYPGKRVINA